MKKQVSLILALTLLCSVFVLPNMVASAASTRPRTATVDELHDAHSVSVGYPVMAKITDGDLYVWGTNASTSPLGLGELKNYPSPMKIDRAVFGGFGVIKAGFHDCGCMAVSEEGKLYQASTATWTEVKPTNGQQLFDGGKILDATFGAYFGMGAKVQATDGSIQWWVLPRTPDNQYRVDTPEMMALFKSATGRDEVIKEVWVSGPATLSTGTPATPINAVLVLMESGEVFGWGENLRGQIPNGWGADGKTKTEIPKTTPYRVTSRPEFSGRKIKQLSLEYNTVVALDDKGTIWTWGSSAGGKLGNGEWMVSQQPDGRIHEYFVHPNDRATPYAAFGPGSVNYSNKRAHYIMTSADHSVVVMTTDNELYGWGGNINAFYEKDYLIPQPIFENVTEKETVLAVRATNKAFYITTQSQDDYFAGDNSGGLAGNGSTSSTPTKEPEVTKPSNIPPTKPSSANKLFMTISTTTDSGLPIEYSAQANNINDLSIRVGQQFTLNIYMEDFAKLTGFYMPITFDPSILQVVNMDGVPYSADDVIRPGFNNGSGLRTNLTSGSNTPDSISTSWVNGVLTNNSRMPVVDNGNGYVSVMGTALLDKELISRITGQVKMFSIEFKAIQPTATVPTPQTTGFKLDGTPHDPMWADKPAKWYSTDLDISSDLDVGKDAVWEFDNVSFFESKFKVVEIKDMILNLYRDNDSLVTDIANDGSGKPDYYRIDKRSIESTYQLKAEVDPTNASWPNIDRWECEFMDSTSHASGASVSDYITVTKSDNDSKSFEFTIAPNISMSDAVLDDEGNFVPGYIKITGYGSHIPNKDNNPEGFRVAYIKITNDVPAPTGITITNKDGYLTGMGGKFLVNASTKLEFNDQGIEDLEDTYTFQAAFTAEDEEDFSTDVKWQLLRVLERNDDGSPKITEALGTDAKAPMVIAADSSNTNPKTPSCKVIAQNSTEDDDDIILKISSGVDPSIYDYVNVKVRLAPYEIVLPSDTITLVYGEGLKQTYDLADKVKVAPGDAKDYTIEYVKTVTAVDNRPDADRGDDAKRVAPNVIVTDAGVIEPVRADKDFHAQSYDEVTVQIQQTLNGTPLTLQKKLKVYTVDAVPPPNMYVDVINSKGTDYDYIKFSVGTNKSQLEVGDKLEIYRDYADTDAIATYTSLTADQIRMLFSPGYNVPVRTVNGDTYALNPVGGTIGYRLTKADGTTYKKTPVMYNPKALKLSGYIKLDTKSLTKATHDGITITINDVVGSDGKSISTTTKANGVLHGYFEFEEYISAKPHTMTISKTNYLTRQVMFTMPSTEDFEISTAEKPIVLYPGDLDGKRGIQYDDFNEYRINWVGRYNSRNENGVLLESFNFYDGSDENGATIININDLMLINMRMGALTSDYTPWLVN